MKEKETSTNAKWNAFLVYFDENGKQMIVHYYNRPMCYTKNKYFEVKMSDKYKFHVDYDDIILLIVDHKVLVDKRRKRKGK